MARSESVHDKMERVRPPRVHIKYESDLNGARKVVDLPFVVGVLGDFAGDGGNKEEFSRRKFTTIDRDNFDAVLKAMKPALSLDVAVTLDGAEAKGETQTVGLKFESLQDFEPANVARQIPALRELLELRERLQEINRAAERSRALEDLLTEALKDGSAAAGLAAALGLGQPKPE